MDTVSILLCIQYHITHKFPTNHHSAQRDPRTSAKGFMTLVKQPIGITITILVFLHVTNNYSYNYEMVVDDVILWYILVLYITESHPQKIEQPLNGPNKYESLPNNGFVWGCLM